MGRKRNIDAAKNTTVLQKAGSRYESIVVNGINSICMGDVFMVSKQFNGNNFAAEPPPPGEYEDCRFENCELGGFNLSHYVFIDCAFTGCNMAMAKLGSTAFRGVQFKDCKMLGLRFDHCHPFLLSMQFDNCVMNLCSFFQVKLKQTKFTNCSLQEADLSEADLTGSIFKHCDLSQAIFSGTILDKADLRTAANYSIDPSTNRVKKAKFSSHGLAGLLYKHDIIIE